MKVLFINTVYGRGSTGRIVADLGKMLEENGHEFKVAYGRGDHSDDPHCYRVGNDLDMYIHAGLSRITDRAGFYSRRATRKLVEFIREYKPDIIHLHNLHGYYLSIEGLFEYLAEEYKGRVIWTLHDCWAFTGHCVHYTYAKCDKWKTGCQSCRQKGQYPSSLILSQAKKNYKKKKELFSDIDNLQIVTPSKWLHDQLGNSILSDIPCIIVNNGIDLNRFVCTKQKREKVILSVMDGLDERKGIYDIIKLRESLPNDYQIRVVGVNHPPRIMYSGIEFIPRTDSVDELVSFYNTARFFINPTYEDNFPTVNLEALACGLPVITYKTGGSPESLSEDSGFVLEPGDIQGLLKACLNNPPKEEECINQAKKYQKEKKYQEYLSLYFSGD